MVQQTQNRLMQQQQPGTLMGHPVATAYQTPQQSHEPNQMSHVAPPFTPGRGIRQAADIYTQDWPHCLWKMTHAGESRPPCMKSTSSRVERIDSFEVKVNEVYVIGEMNQEPFFDEELTSGSTVRLQSVSKSPVVAKAMETSVVSLHDGVEKAEKLNEARGQMQD
ncbi:hypothetical protein L915_21968, partial [Phytophthora nicotianae]